MSNKIVTTEHTEFTETRKGLNELTEIVIGCAIEVHRALGPGLLINFNVELLKHGIRRRVLGLVEEVTL